MFPGNRKLLSTLLLIFIAVLTAAPLKAEPLKASVSYYADSRDYSTLAVAMSSNRLPVGLTFWGFTDLHGDQDQGYDSDLTRTFSEYRLSHTGLGEWLSIEGLGLQYEYDNITPGNGHISRLGVTFKHTLADSGWLQWRVFPIESGANGQHLSVIYSWVFTDKLSLSGFADYNAINAADNRWVIEPQLNYRIAPRAFILLEYRYNGFEDNTPTLDGDGVALGIRYDL